MTFYIPFFGDLQNDYYGFALLLSYFHLDKFSVK